MNMPTRRPRRFTKIALRAFCVVSSKDVSKLFHGEPVGVEWLKGGDRDLNIYDGFGRQTRYGCRSDMIDPQSRCPQGGAKFATQLRKARRPNWVVRHNLYNV